MNFKCIIGFHDWSKDCGKCAKCGKSRSNSHHLSEWRCTKCGKPALPKILIVGVTPPKNIMAAIHHDCWIADLYIADIPDGWDGENCVLVQKNPPQTSSEELIQMATKKWPDVGDHFKNLDLQIIHTRFYDNICVIRQPRVKPHRDLRYPEDFFPHRFSVIFWDNQPLDFGQFLREGHYRHTPLDSNMACEVSFDSHDEVTCFLSELRKLPTKSGKTCIPYSLELCPHGKYFNAGLCKRFCTSQ